MKIYVELCSIGLVSLILVGCGDTERARRDTSKQIQTNVAVDRLVWSALGSGSDSESIIWRKFSADWSSSKTNIGFAWHEDRQRFEGGVDATAIVADRYLLQLAVEFWIKKDQGQVVFDNVRCHFTEVKAVRPTSGGGYYVSFNTSSDRWLRPDDLKQLIESNWDFSRVGINVISNDPVPNIQNLRN
jgi:hypothetical protein